MSKNMRKNIKRYACLILALMLAFSFIGCNEAGTQNDGGTGGERVGADTVKGNVDTKRADGEFIEAYNSFALEFLKTAVDENDGKTNLLISPLSVLTALAMTANGANGDTLSEMQTVLAGGMEIEKLNAYIGHLAENLGESLKIANSIWMKNESGVEVKQEFLQKNTDYYGAEIFKAAFDETTVLDINTWVDENTDGMITKLLEEIDPNTFMYLINALAFEAEWKEKYNENSVYEGFFRAFDGSKRVVEYMAGTESKYIVGTNVRGFIKPYADEKYSFAVLLPDDIVNIYDYIKTLDGETLFGLLDSARDESVDTVMPKFALDFDINLNEALKKMGMPKAFLESEADFSRMASSAAGNIYIGNVLHKTFMNVDEAGTKAGAVTSVDMLCEGFIEKKVIVLDRPFICMIIDNESLLPIFMGTVGNIGKKTAEGDGFATISSGLEICDDHGVNTQVKYTHEYENLYCGNTLATIESVMGSFSQQYTGERAVLITDILRTLDYNEPTCRCMAEYRIITEFGTFEVNLTEAFARCEKGQAALNDFDVNVIRDAIGSRTEK